MNKKIGLGILALVIIGGVIFYNKSKSGVGEVTYQTEKVSKGSLVSTLTVSGTVAGANSVAINTTSTGVVKKIYVTEGQEVKVGQKLLDMELDLVSRQKYQQALASYQSSKNSLESSKSNLYSLQSKLFAANQKLINDGVARGLSVDDPNYIQQNADWLSAESAYKNQEQAINTAQNSLNASYLSLQQASPTIYAPISGKISGLALQPGSIVSTSKIANVQSTAGPVITVNLGQVEVTKVKVGQKAMVSLDAFEGKTFAGVVSSIDTLGGSSSGVTTYPMSIKLEPTTILIYPNMTAQASIILAVKDDVLVVPSGAVTTGNGTSSVKVMNNKVVSNVTVEVGISSDTQTEIISGLSEGQEVVTSSTSTATSTTSAGQSLFSNINRGGFGGGGGAVRIAR